MPRVKDIPGFKDTLETALNNASKEWDINFVSDMEERFEKFGTECTVSEKQLEQLERIACT